MQHAKVQSSSTWRRNSKVSVFKGLSSSPLHTPAKTLDKQMTWGWWYTAGSHGMLEQKWLLQIMDQKNYPEFMLLNCFWIILQPPKKSFLSFHCPKLKQRIQEGSRNPMAKQMDKTTHKNRMQKKHATTQNPKTYQTKILKCSEQYVVSDVQNEIQDSRRRQRERQLCTYAFMLLCIYESMNVWMYECMGVRV